MAGGKVEGFSLFPFVVFLFGHVCTAAIINGLSCDFKTTFLSKMAVFFFFSLLPNLAFPAKSNRVASLP